MRIPADDEIRALHRAHAPTPAAFDLVYTHCEIVAAVAGQLLAASGFPADAALVRAGALLHDIGVYRLYDETGHLDHARYIQHGILGQELLRAAGYPEVICRFAAHHTGTGLTRDEVLRQRLPLPPADYLAETPEETAVMYADKFHSKTSPPVFLTAGAYARTARRYGPGQVAAFEAMREKLGEPDLVPLARRYGQRIIGVDAGDSGAAAGA